MLAERLARDSPLEERGFELLVPRTDGVAFPNTFCRPGLHRLKADPFRPEGSGRRVEFHFPPPRLGEPAPVSGKVIYNAK
jgi:hypothetical protein